MKIWRIIATVLIFSSINFCKAQQAEIIKWNKLNELLNKKTDTTYVINFWATWCKPCITELPYFLEKEKQLSNKAIKFYFISLDFKRDFSTRLLSFLEKQNITSNVYLLDEPDYNAWIDKVDTRWGGAIPATVIYNASTNRRDFYEKEFTSEELEQTLNTYIQ